MKLPIRSHWKAASPGRVALGVGACLLALAVCADLLAQSKPTEYQVKAAYLFNFGKFVKWPAAAANGEFPICILGQDPFGPVLDSTVAGEEIDGKRVVARRVSRPEDAAACRVVFISASEESRIRPILAILNRAGVLTVSDMPHFVQRGGMIQFVWDGNRVRFEVSLPAAEHAGLNLSSELLKVASVVHRDAGPGD